MPKLKVYDTSRKITTQRTLAFAKGVLRTDSQWDVRHENISEYLKEGFPGDLVKGDAIATLGILRGTGLLLKEAVERGIDYYYIDHAYFNSGYKGKGWMRIVKNGHSVTNIKTVTNERWKKFFKSNNNCLPWKHQEECGKKILICPPTHAVSWYKDINHNWGNTIMHRLKEILPEEEHQWIKIRPKPNEPIVDKLGNLIRLEPNYDKVPLEEDLKEARCVIAYNSNVALQATLLGIPVITGDISPCKPISFNIEDFRQRPRGYVEPFCIEPPNRSALLYWLSNNQWKHREIEDGTAWQMLKENYNGA